MNKNKVFGLVIGAAVMLSPFMASAASISNPLFSNGQTSIDATGGSNVSGTYTLTVGAGEVVEYTRVQSDGSQPFVDTSVGGQLGYQEGVYTNLPFTVKVPPNTGTYNPTVQGAGIFGGARSINGGDNVVLGSTNLGTVRVVANAPDNSGSSSTGGVVVGGDDFWTKLASIFAAALKVALPSTPAASALCAQIPSDTVSLQAFLMAHGQSAPFAAAGVYAPTGFYGPITIGALASFKSANSCI